MKIRYLIVIIIAISGLALVFCNNGSGDGIIIPDLSGSITISPNVNVSTGMQLSASYNGDEIVSYQWMRFSTEGGDSTNVGTNSDSYTPNQAGTYTVTVSADGFTSKTSAAVIVTGPTIYTVTFYSNGGTALHPVTVNSGTIITAPADPTRDAAGFYDFAGWYKEAELITVWAFASDIVTSDSTLYARWTPLKAIGDTGPGGGIIYHVDPVGFTVEGYASVFDCYTAYYLELAPFSGEAEWGPMGSFISGVTSTPLSGTDSAIAIGNGRKDTLTIIAHLAAMQPPQTDKAANIAAAATFGSQHDWFLPSMGELHLLYGQRNLQGIAITSGWFWSSSQYSIDSAWNQDFNTGLRAHDSKLNYNLYLVIRAF